jgi:hypothetical protein
VPSTFTEEFSDPEAKDNTKMVLGVGLGVDIPILLLLAINGYLLARRRNQRAEPGSQTEDPDTTQRTKIEALLKALEQTKVFENSQRELEQPQPELEQPSTELEQPRPELEQPKAELEAVHAVELEAQSVQRREMG